MTAHEHDWLAEQFEEHRPHLRRVAYRMLGTLDESEDAVQEAWLRLNRTRSASIENLGGWLTTVVGRVCLDILRKRRARREESTDAWLPDPIVSVDERTDPEQEALLADSVGLALLVVLETLSPAERLAFVLHDSFGVPFDEIAPVVDRTPEATRQLASRARRRVRGARPEGDADPAEQKRVLDAFLAASLDGDFEALVAVLDPDVVLRTDHALPRGAPGEIRGAEAVASNALKFAALAPLARPALVNGQPGFYVAPEGRLFAVGAFTVAGGRITEIDIVADPEKLARIDLG
jgi:RNA polymerase sigma factor (sigma-70 family)